MEHFDNSKFRLRISIRAEAQCVYNAWAIPSVLEKWFLKKAEFSIAFGMLKNSNDFIERNDCYEWSWQGWGDEMIIRGKILEANGKNHIRFTFGKAGIVTVNIQKEEDETVLELLQEEIPTEEHSGIYYHAGCKNEWLFHLANLKHFLEGGSDLRNQRTKNGSGRIEQSFSVDTTIIPF